MLRDQIICMDEVKEFYAPQIKIPALKSWYLHEMNKPWQTLWISTLINLFLNAYINHHVHAEHSKTIEFYSSFGIQCVFLCTWSIHTNKTENTYHICSMCVNTGHNMSLIISLWGFFQSSRAAFSYVLMVGSWRISNQSKILWLSLLPVRIKMKELILMLPYSMGLVTIFFYQWCKNAFN